VDVIQVHFVNHTHTVTVSSLQLFLVLMRIYIYIHTHTYVHLHVFNRIKIYFTEYSNMRLLGSAC